MAGINVHPAGPADLEGMISLARDHSPALVDQLDWQEAVTADKTPSFVLMEGEKLVGFGVSLDFYPNDRLVNCFSPAASKYWISLLIMEILQALAKARVERYRRGEAPLIKGHAPIELPDGAILH